MQENEVKLSSVIDIFDEKILNDINENIKESLVFSFMNNLPNRSHLNIFIPGCGTCAEIAPLIALLSARKITAIFFCVDTNADALKKAKDKTIKQVGYECKFIEADVSNIEQLRSKGLKSNNFDVAIFRNFPVLNYPDAVLKLFKDIFPEFLKEGAPIFISYVNTHEGTVLAELYNNPSISVKNSKFTLSNPVRLLSSNPNFWTYDMDFESFVIKFSKKIPISSEIPIPVQIGIDLHTKYAGTLKCCYWVIIDDNFNLINLKGSLFNLASQKDGNLIFDFFFSKEQAEVFLQEQFTKEITAKNLLKKGFIVNFNALMMDVLDIFVIKKLKVAEIDLGNLNFINCMEYEFNPKNNNLSNVATIDSDIVKRDEMLYATTLSFFNSNLSKIQWKPYPAKGLTGKYTGHTVRFFNMGPGAKQATEFNTYLNNSNFDTVKTVTSGGQDSIIVDLTTSKLTL